VHANQQNARLSTGLFAFEEHSKMSPANGDRDPVLAIRTAAHIAPLPRVGPRWPHPTASLELSIVPEFWTEAAFNKKLVAETDDYDNQI
jgi:hypothetical protein